MKFRPVVLFITVLSTALSLMSAAAPPKKTVTKKKASTTKTTVTHKPMAARKTSTAKSPAITRKGARRAPVVSRAPVVKRSPSQAAPSPERYREIQSALAEKGYLKSEPNGVWDADSIDAMKRYQADQKQDPSGKITAASLIGLGLGSSTASPLPPAQTPK